MPGLKMAQPLHVISVMLTRHLLCVLAADCPPPSPYQPCVQVGQALQSVTAAAGDDEDLRASAAAATGAFAKHCRYAGVCRGCL